MDRPETGFDSAAPDARSVSRRVVEEVATVTETDPTDLDPLYEFVDPDCLDAIFAETTAGTGHLSFPVNGRRVVVWADGTVEVDPADVPPGVPHLGADDDPSTTASGPPD